VDAWVDDEFLSELTWSCAQVAVQNVVTLILGMVEAQSAKEEGDGQATMRWE
jgi:hypothetical protein